MAVYEISRGNLEKYLDGQIEKNPKYANLREELIDAFAGTIDPKQIEVNSGEENLWPFSADDPSQLFIPDKRYHIRLKDTALEFMQSVFFGGLFEIMYSVFTGGASIGVGVISVSAQFIFFVKKIVREFVVKLDDPEYAIYVELISHFMEHREIDIKDVVQWITDERANPLYTTKVISEMKTEDIRRIMDSMVQKSVLLKQGEGKYSINF